MVSQNSHKFTFPCHLEAVKPKDLIFYCHLKGKAVKMRFFADAQNDSVDFGTVSVIDFKDCACIV